MYSMTQSHSPRISEYTIIMVNDVVVMVSSKTTILCYHQLQVGSAKLFSINLPNLVNLSPTKLLSFIAIISYGTKILHGIKFYSW